MSQPCFPLAAWPQECAWPFCSLVSSSLKGNNSTSFIGLSGALHRSVGRKHLDTCQLSIAIQQSILKHSAEDTALRYFEQEPAVWVGPNGGAYLCATRRQFGHLSGARGSGFEMAHSADWQVAGCWLGTQLGCGQGALLLLHGPVHHTTWWLGSRSKGPSRKRWGLMT